MDCGLVFVPGDLEPWHWFGLLAIDVEVHDWVVCNFARIVTGPP